MGADIKSLRVRIRSVDSTLHLTKAMGLVASSKIRRAGDAMEKGRAYAEAWRSVIKTLALSPDCKRSRYCQQSGGGRTRLIVIAGDRGLCGGYNANIFRLLRQYPDAELIPIGKRACERMGKKENSSEKYSREEGYALALSLCRDFLAGEYDTLGIVCSRYHSILTQEAVMIPVLPLCLPEASSSSVLLCEPSEAEILDTVMPDYVAGLLMAAVRESFACEMAARRMAMDSAQKNASDMIDSLTLRYNRARQGAITQEITEIVAGSNS